VNRTIINKDIMNLNVVENDGVRGNFLKNGNFTTSTVGEGRYIVGGGPCGWEHSRVYTSIMWFPPHFNVSVAAPQN
jgi:hypothetical protein